MLYNFILAPESQNIRSSKGFFNFVLAPESQNIWSSKGLYNFVLAPESQNIRSLGITFERLVEIFRNEFLRS